MKKDGGTIKNWQLHHIKLTDSEAKRCVKVYPDVMLCPGPMVFTGTVVEDKAGRWKPGYHMRSTLICKIDRKHGIIETQNTIYNVVEEGGDIFPDLGNDVLNITY